MTKQEKVLASKRRDSLSARRTPTPTLMTSPKVLSLALAQVLEESACSMSPSSTLVKSQSSTRPMSCRTSVSSSSSTKQMNYEPKPLTELHSYQSSHR